MFCTLKASWVECLPSLGLRVAFGFYPYPYIQCDRRVWPCMDPLFSLPGSGTRPTRHPVTGVNGNHGPVHGLPDYTDGHLSHLPQLLTSPRLPLDSPLHQWLPESHGSHNLRATWERWGDAGASLSNVNLFLSSSQAPYSIDHARIAFLMGSLGGRALEWATAVWDGQRPASQHYLSFIDQCSTIPPVVRTRCVGCLPYVRAPVA